MKRITAILLITILSISLAGCKLESGSYESVKPTVKTYEVLNVNSYVQNETNGYGAIIGSHLAYSFTYVDGSGKLHDKTDFENLEYGLTKVKIGDENKYVIESGGFDEYRTLYLTRDTFNKLNKE